MSSITLNSNIAALNAQRRLGLSTRSLQDSFTRLSSGLRINRTSDDAAGLAIASSLAVDRKVYNQGVRNLNDGVSLLSIADGALSELTTITTRLTELAQQSANGALSNVQREALDEEAQALKREYFRIAKTAEFNGMKLFDGELIDLRLQAGFGENGGISSNIGGAIGNGEFETVQNYSAIGFPQSLVSSDFNGDGYVDLATSSSSSPSLSVLINQGDGTYGAATEYNLGDNAGSVSSGDLNNDGIVDLVAPTGGSGELQVLLGIGDGTFAQAVTYASGLSTGAQDISIADFNNDGMSDLAVGASGSISVLFGQGNGTLSAGSSFSTSGVVVSTLESYDFNGDGVLDLASVDGNENGGPGVSVFLGRGDGSFQAGVTYALKDAYPLHIGIADFNNDGFADFAIDEAGASGSGSTVGILLGNGDGSFKARNDIFVGSTPGAVAIGDFNGDGNEDFVGSANSIASIRLGNGDGTFQSAGTISLGAAARELHAKDVNGDGVLDLAATLFSGQPIAILLGDSDYGISPLHDFSLATILDARQALPVFQQKLDQLASQRGQIGAFESRLSSALSTTRTSSENFAAAQSQIMDADIAIESARLVKNQISQQAGVAILAQASQSPALALQLLS